MEPGEVSLPENVTLEVLNGEQKGEIFTINNKTITIGRADVCDFKLKEGYISNKHCQIVFRNDHFTIIDLGSLNKTKVNGNVYVQKNLHDQDIIRLGKTELRFNWKGIDESKIDASEDIPGEEAASES